MLKNKLFILSVAIFISGLSYANANLALSDLVVPKEPAYRVGISEIPENQYIEAQQTQPVTENLLNELNNDNTDVSYAELSLKRLSREISQDLMYEEQDMVSDLTLLWQGAAMQSDTINFALYKLANPDADKPNKSTVKNILKTIASMSTLAGAGIGNPLLAGSSLIGGNILNIMTQDTKSLNYKYTKVSDADMIILIRKVEDLQQNAVNLYYDYMSAKKQLEMTTDVVNERKQRYEKAQDSNASRELIVVTDAYYRTAIDRQKTARSEFLSKRAALEQFVGNEAFTQFENELAERDKKNKTSNQEDDAYKEIIQSVENYTSQISSSKEESNAFESSETDKVLQDDESIIAKNKEEDTKGLIFVHKEKNTQEQQVLETPVQEETVTTDKKKKKSKKAKKERNIDVEFSTKTPVEAPVTMPKNKTINGVELLPLEELKAPDFRNGRSIFVE